MSTPRKPRRARPASSPSRPRRVSTARKGTTTSLLLRGIDRDIVDVFKARARCHGRSLQAELQLSLRRDAHRNFEEAAAISAAWHERLRERDLPDTLPMLREDRSR